MNKGLGEKKATLLIYLPCYLDFPLAVKQAQKVRKLSDAYENYNHLEIKVMISCNGVDFSEEERIQLLEHSDWINIFPFGISGDINITQGFMHAIRLEADYLWILSSNDSVSDNFIETIVNNLVTKQDVNILVGCTSENLKKRRIESVFNSNNRDVPFGLISSVVYRTKEMNRNFDSGVQMNWTGWGQLAVIEASCIALNGLEVALVSESDLYTRSIRTMDDELKEEERVRNGYAHSFFGMPIVINTIHTDNKYLKRKYLNSWILSNWYLVGYFLRTDFKLWNSHIASNQSWLRDFSFAVIRNASPLHRLIFHFAKRLNLYAFRNYAIARWFRENLIR